MIRLLPCPTCRGDVRVTVVDSANGWRDPTHYDDVFAGRFNTGECRRCGRMLVVEREVLFTDLERGIFVGVFPWEDRARLDACAASVDAAFDLALGEGAPPFVRGLGARVRRRVVFGYDQLRDKLLCFRAGLDDRVVEASKAVLLAFSPQWIDFGVVDLVAVDAVDGGLALGALDADGSPVRGFKGVFLAPELLGAMAGPGLSDEMPRLFADSSWVHHSVVA